ncbi:MAG TPA: pitrilysin family protein, partial [Tepidisphaeraceae bacterium]
PVVHVRVLYHVGSRDEREDRQGFAHLFEHMMFRGSAHVAPEQHMKLIGTLGGDSNAFTSFDQTTYTNTLPSTGLEMALYLEADRLASFKVDDKIFQTERNVVAEEWRMRYANQPLGGLNLDVLRTAFTKHGYRWTPIGDMDQLREATSSELQQFFNRYYLPNNACLVIAGDVNIAQTRQWVEKYFGWIPAGPEVKREDRVEPEQTQTRRLVVEKPNVPLTNMVMAFKAPDYKSDDQYALYLLGDILASGRTGRLDRALVTGENPTCVSVGAGSWQLEDPSLFMVNAVVQKDAEPEAVQKQILVALAEIADKGVEQAELDRVIAQTRQALIRNRETADEVAAQLAEEQVFGGDAQRVNTSLDKLKAVTPQEIQRVARAYLVPEKMTIVQYRPGATGQEGQAAADAQAAKATEVIQAEVAKSPEVVPPRVTEFPADYPKTIPQPAPLSKVVFDKGIEQSVKGVQVVTLNDSRLPLVNLSLILRAGSHAEPADKAGLGDLTAQMMRRGSGGIPFLEFAADLESRGIAVEITDSGDNTRLNIACTSDQLDYALDKAAAILGEPNFAPEEFAKLKQQAIGRLTQALSNPATAASRTLAASLYPQSPLGRSATPQSLAGITLDDVKQWYAAAYQPAQAVLIISGDVKPENGPQTAERLLAK